MTIIQIAEVKNLLKKLEITDQTQKMFANELLKISDPYVPFRSGNLKASGRVVENGKAIEYNTPYARYLWYGKLMVYPITGKRTFHNEDYGFWSRPKTPKVLTDRDLNFKGSPIRGAFWVERAFIANKENLEQQLIDYITKGK